MPTPKRSVWLYLVLVLLFSAPWWALMLHAGSIELARGFVIHIQMWAPALAALTASWLMQRSVAGIGWGWGRGRYVAAGYLLPIAYSLLAYVPLWLSGLAPAAFGAFAARSAAGLAMTTLPPAWPAMLQVALTLSFGIVQSAASAAGEEIGWRGYLVPALRERFGFAATAGLSGLVWAAWHMPLVLFADYHGGAPKAYSVACFTVMIVASGAIAAWLRLRSGSVWPAILLHATHNAVVQWLLDPMTVADGRGAWFAGEFGLALALSTSVVALVVCTRPIEAPAGSGAHAGKRAPA
jgi:membrane protease YdiL (CAAX protease family)